MYFEVSSEAGAAGVATGAGVVCCGAACCKTFWAGIVVHKQHQKNALLV
jgi:hypothetical protein